MKYDISTTFYDEAKTYTDLALKQNRTSSGSGTYTSTSSNTTYNYNGENDLLNQLQTVLLPYLILAKDWNDLNNGVGSTPTLTTTNKVVVGAINELNSNVGDKTSLQTVNKSNVVNAINEVNTKVDNIKPVGSILYSYKNIGGAL